MNLFNIFKRKNKTSSKGHLSLCLSFEELLQKAIMEPAYRVEFYKRLLSEVFFIIAKGKLPTGKYQLEECRQTPPASPSYIKFAIFTSSERIFDNGVIKEVVAGLDVDAKDFFEYTKNTYFVLNPYSDYSKELTAEEIEAVLSGTIFVPLKREKNFKKPATAQLTRPANYPTEIVNSLKLFFSRNTHIKTAYLGWISYPSLDTPPHHIIALQCDSDLENTIDETVFTASEVLSEIVKNGDIPEVVGLSGWGYNDFQKAGIAPFYKA